MNPSIVEKVVEQLSTMPPNLQQQVLDYATSLTKRPIRGVPGQQLLQMAGTITPDDVRLMREAIEHDCEQVDQGEW